MVAGSCCLIPFYFITYCHYPKPLNTLIIFDASALILSVVLGKQLNIPSNMLKMVLIVLDNCKTK